MIIDARLATETKYGRPYTLSAAVANFLDEINIGQSVQIDGLIDPMGQNSPRINFDVMVSKHKRDRRFTVRACRNGAMATITRIA